MWTLAAFGASLGITILVMWHRVGLNLSLSSVLLSLLLLLHGPAYVYYTRTYGPDTDFFDTIMSAAKGNDVLPTLDLAMALTFTFVCLGIVFTDVAAGVRARGWHRAIARWDAKPLGRATPRERRRVLGASIALAALLLVPFIFIDSQLPKVVDYFTSDLGEFEKIALRREGGGSGFYPYNLLLSTVLPFIAFCLLAGALSRARSLRGWTMVFVALVALGKAATLSKAPLAVFALQGLVVWLMAWRLSLSWRMLAVLAISTTALFVLMSFIANPTSEGLGLIFEFLFYRVFMIVNESLLEYFAAIPYVIDHTWGSQFSWLAGLLQSEPRLPTYWLVAEVHRGALGSTTTVMFAGDAWADFAWVGVAIAAFVIGALVRWIDIRLIVTRGKSVVTIAGLALGHSGLFIATSTSLQTALVTGGLALVVPLVAMMSNARRRPAPMPAALTSEGSAP